MEWALAVATSDGQNFKFLDIGDFLHVLQLHSSTLEIPCPDRGRDTLLLLDFVAHSLMEPQS
jgi:hypothetical protein